MRLATPSQVKPGMIDGLTELQIKVQTLEDAYSIRNLKARYTGLPDERRPKG